LDGGPPGVELHTVADELPSRDAGGIVPVVLPATDAVTGIVGVDNGVAVVGDVAAIAAIGLVPPIVEAEVTDTVGAPGAIWPDGVVQVTTVPDIVGSEANGTGANVVLVARGCVVAENGLGPLSGDVTIIPGVDTRPRAVVPMVQTCARLASHHNTRASAVNHVRGIGSIPSPSI
jgi:hypothetical protein